MIRVALIGSTGSIGTQVLNVIKRHSDKYEVAAIVANSNTELLLKQYNEFRPSVVGVVDTAAYKALLGHIPTENLIAGNEALTYPASLSSVDIVVLAVSGMIGLYSVESAIKNNKKIALANKESLVAGGELVGRLLKDNNGTIIPIDSEHSAIMQCLSAGRREDVKRLILTASGGAFYGKARSELQNITPNEAVKHPTWSMGMKISIDSATMMNKALEIIEARYLFDTDKIDYIIHPESIVHSMVEYCDGSLIAQMGIPSMEIPIQYALSMPYRFDTSLSPLQLSTLTFKQPDEINFPAPKLAKYCLHEGLDQPCRFNAANEAAVALFTNGKIRFTDIYDIVERVVLSSKKRERTTIEALFDCYNETVDRVKSLV